MHQPIFADQVTPMVNMVHIQPYVEESLHTILEESPSFESSGSSETVDEIAATVLTPPSPTTGGELFLVSLDIPPRDGENDEDRVAHLRRNELCATRRENEAWIEQNEANHKAAEDGVNHPPPHNLQVDLDQASDIEIYQTPSTNLAIAANKLAKL